MAKQINIEMNVKANTQQAQQALNSLSKNLQDIQNIKNMPIISSESYQQAATAAKDLERNLQSAVNVKTGKLDLNKFSMSLKQSNTSITELAAKLSGAGTTGQQAFLNLAKSIALADNSALSLGNKLGGLLTSLKNTARWQISSSLLHGFMGAISGAYGYAQDLNKSLNNIRIVTGQTTDQMAEFAKEANKAAQSLSTTTTAYTNAALIYYQQGLSDEDVKKRTDTTIKLANVSRQSAEEVSSQMTAIWNNFAKAGDNLDFYADVITKLGATTAASSEEISDGLSKFAAVADTVGLSYNKAAAAVATVVAETRQSADVVGTAFKTVFARLEGLKLGETLEDDVDLTKYSKALESVGVNVLDSNRELKNMDTILNELGEKWDSISKSQQIALAQTVGGMRQYNQFIALMDNYDKVLQNENVAEDSSGTLQKQADTYAESWEAASKRVKAAAQEIYSQLLNDDFFIDVLGGFEKFLGIISNVIDGLGGVKGLLLLIGSIFMQTYAKEMPRILQSIGNNLMVIVGQGQKVKQSMLDELEAQMVMERNSESALTKQGMGEEMNAKYNSTQKAIEMTKQLNIEMKNLSQSEIAERKAKIDQVVADGEYLAQLGKEIDLLNKKKESLTQDIVKNAGATFANSSNKNQLGNLYKEDESGFIEFESVEGKTSSQAIEDEEKILYNLQKKRKGNNNKIQYRENNIKQLNNEVSDIQSYVNTYGLSEEISEKVNNNNKALIENEQEIKNLNTENLAIDKEIEQHTQAILALKENEANMQKEINEKINDNVGASKLLKNETEQIGIRTKNWKDMQASINKMATGNKQQQAASKKMTEELAKSMTNYGDKVKQAAEKAKNLVPEDKQVKFDNLISQVNKFQEAVQKAANGIGSWEEVNKMLSEDASLWQQLSEAAKLSEAEIEKTIRELAFKYNIPKEKLKEFSQDIADTYIKQQKLDEGMARPNEPAKQKIYAASELYSKLGSTIMQVSFAINSLKSIGDIFSNDDLSAGEKMVQLMTTLGTIIPILTTLINKQKVAETSMAVLRLIGAKNTTIYAAAQAIANGEMVKGAVAAKALLGPMALLAAAIGGMIFIFSLFGDSAKKSASELETTTAALEASKKAAEETKQAYEDLKNKISNYDSAIEALKKCAKGTREWREAFVEVQSQVNELLTTFPELLKYSNLFNPDRTLNQDVLNEFLDKQQRILSISNTRILANQAQEKNAEYNELQRKSLSPTKEDTQLAYIFKDEKTFSKTNGSYMNSNDIIASVYNGLKQNNIDFSQEEILRNAVQSEFDKLDLAIPVGDYEKTIDKAVESLTDSFNTNQKSFEELALKADEVADSFEQASASLFEGMFGDKVFSNENEKIAYQVAVDNEYQKIIEKYHKGLVAFYEEGRDNWDKISESKDSGISKESRLKYGGQAYDTDVMLEMIERYAERHGLDINKENLTDWDKDTKTANVNFKKGTEKIVESAEKIYEEMLPVFLEEAIKEIPEVANKIINNISDENKAKYVFQATKSFDEVSYEDMQKAGYIKDNEITFKNLEEFKTRFFEGDEKRYKNYVAQILQKSVDELKEEDYTKVFELLNINIKQALGQMEYIPDFIKKRLGPNLISEIDTGYLKQVGELYTNVLAGSGEEGISILQNIIKNAGEESDEVLQVLSTMDLTSSSADDINNKLHNLGINFKITSADATSLSNILRKVSTMSVEAVQEQYKTVSSILSKIKEEGSIIEKKDYDELIKLNPMIESFFTQLADGTYMLTGAANEFKKTVQTSLLGNLQNTFQEQLSTIYAYQDSSILKNDVKNLNTQNIPQEQAWKIYSDDTMQRIQVLKDNNHLEEANQLLARINSKDEENKNYINIIKDAATEVDKLNLSTDEFNKKLEEAREKATKLKDSIEMAEYQNELSNNNLDFETTEKYAKTLQELHGEEKMSIGMARELAIANQRLDRGLSNLNDNLDDYKKKLQASNKGSAEWANALEDLKENLADILNVDISTLSNDFAQSALASEDLALALDGDVEAIQRLQSELAEDMIANISTNLEDDNLKTFLDEWKYLKENMAEKIKSPTVDQSDLIKSFDNMIEAGSMTKEQIEAALAGLHVSADLETDYTHSIQKIPQTRTISRVTSGPTEVQGPVPPGGQMPVEWTVETTTEQTAPVPVDQWVPTYKIKGVKGRDGQNTVRAFSAAIPPTPSYGSTTSGKSSGGGGGSSPTTKAASHKHEVNRYSDEENLVNGLSKQYEQLEKAKDKAFGLSKIQAMEKEVSKLKELTEAQKKYLEAVTGTGNGNKLLKAIQNGESIGSLIISGALGGTLSADYKSLFGGKSASGKKLEYTVKDSAGNERLKEDEYSLSAFNKLFGTNIQFQLDSFGNIQNKDDILNLLQNLENKESDRYSRIAEPSAAAENDHNKFMAWVEEMKERMDQFGDTLEKSYDLIDEYMDRITATQEKNAEIISAKLDFGVMIHDKTIQKYNRALKVLGDDIYKSVEAMELYYNSKIGKENTDYWKTQTQEIVEQFANVQDRVEKFRNSNGIDENGLSPEQAQELYNTMEEQVDSLQDEILDGIESIRNYYGDTIDYWNEEISKVNRTIDFNISTLQHYQKVMELLGKSTDYAFMRTIINAQVQTSRSDFEAKQFLADESKARLNKAWETYNSLTDEKEKEEYKKSVIDKEQLNYEETEAEAQAALEQFLEYLNAWYENEINAAVKEFNKAMAGSWGDLDYLAQSMERAKSIAESYLTKTNQLYETNTMLRKISQDIDKNDSIAAKQKLKAFADEIEAMKEQNQLSKSSLEIAKARYEVLQAQIALEEAQKAKSTVRLKRDSEGNYGYVYTADQDAISDAEQNLADKQNNLYNLVLGYTNDYSEQIKQLEQEHMSALEEIAKNTNLKDDERNQRILEINEQFLAKREALLKDYNEAAGWLDKTAATDRQEAWSNSYQQTILDQDAYKKETEKLIEDITTKYTDFKTTSDEVTKQAGLDADGLKEKINPLVEQTSNLADNVKDIGTNMHNALTDVDKLTAGFARQKGKIDKLITSLSGLGDKINEEFQKLANLKAEANNVINNAGKQNPSNINVNGGNTNKLNSTSSPSSSSGSNEGTNYSYTPSHSHNWITEYFYRKDAGTNDRYLYSRKKCSTCSETKDEKKLGKWEWGDQRYDQANGNYINLYRTKDNKLEKIVTKYPIAKGKTGLYTGTWDGPDLEENGKLAFLHQKELVLNAQDTENMLAAVQLIRQISQTIDLQAAAREYSLGLSAIQYRGNDQTLQQEVTIHAEFPNVQDHNEIEQAFDNLINRASQYVNRKDI